MSSVALELFKSCRFCSESFISADELYKHEKTHSCSKCERVFTSRDQHTAHMAYNDCCQCSVCGMECNSLEGVNLHMRTTHKPDNTNTNDAAQASTSTDAEDSNDKPTSVSSDFNIINDALVNNSTIVGRDYHDSSDVYSSDSESSNTDIIESPNYINKRGKLIKRLESKHSAAKPFTCSHCGKGFALQIALKQHGRKCNTKKTYSCKICSEEFKEHFNFRHHLEVHVSRHPFLCPVCSLSCRSQLQLNTHKATHLVASQRGYVLEGIEFPKVAPSETKKQAKREPLKRLKTAPYSKYKSEEKSSGCVEGPVRYVCKVKESSYKCDVCNKQFRHPMSLIRHQPSHKIASAARQLQTAGKLRMGEVVPLLSCSYCEEKFRSKCGLSLHVTQHLTQNNQRQLKC